jgi:type 1 glutamine amidotransferase
VTPVRLIAVCILTLLAVAIGAALAAQPARQPRILVFTKTAGFRHSSIPAAVRAVRELGRQNGLVVEATEDGAAFTTANLARYEAVVFLMTTGDVLDNAQQAAFERYFRASGGFVGIHSAADTEYGWPWYGRMLGTYFRSHPQIQQGAIDVQNRRHPSTVGLPRRWTRTDEWYNFTRNPRPSVRVLATLDESSYGPGNGAMGRDHPIAWSHAFQGGRAWFTGGGHTDESYSEPLFRKHLIGGIRYAAGLTPPRIVSVSARVRNARLTVAVRYRSCRPCRGILRVRSTRIPIALGAGKGRAQTRALPRGRWQFTVVLEDRATGLSDSARGSAVVS